MKRFIFFAIDQYTLKVFRRKEWEAGVRHDVTCEQQRIIKLLEGKMEQECGFGITHDLIALIKGESNGN